MSFKEANEIVMCMVTLFSVHVARAKAVECADSPGNNFREELRRLPLELPSIFDGVAKAICCDKIANAIEYHQALQTYLHDCEIPVVVSVSDSTSSSSSKKDRKNKKKGKKQAEMTEDVESTTDEPFELVVAPHKFFGAIDELRNASNELVETKAALDFEAEAAEISWDISLDDSGNAEAGEIDWGIETVASTDPTADGDAPVEIDWDITTSDVVEPVSEEPAAEMETTLDVSTSDEQVTRVGLLDDNEFRTRVLNDLLEMRAFLRQRLVELSASDSVAFANQFQGSSPLLEQQSATKIEEFQAAVDQAVSLLTSKRLQQLVLIKTSDRYLDRHVANLEMLTKHMDKCHREILALEDKNVDLIDATKSIQPQIAAMVMATKKLKKEVRIHARSTFLTTLFLTVQ
ncbi:unnamed protein product [Phytophthora fragariaefolia]|uniref:Unnamed protein product n=1 Tax=Phytophthora fragariaefolia TaxID=1490495 RepID=A0A9W6Y0J6_9STRA|nr:unnamed protein product [Phytophthora fragariaefolia]